MGVQKSCSSVDLIHAKVRSWIAGWWGVESDKFLMAGVSDRKICYGCRSHLSSPVDGHRCQSCGLLFCIKCMERAIGVVGSHLGGGITSEYEQGQPKLCEFCSQAIVRGRVAMEYDERMGSSVSPRRFRDVRPPYLMEVQQQCSPLSLRCSTARTVEEDEEDIGKNFWSPCSVFSQDVSDMDSSSFSTGNELYSFKSFTPSPLDSPNRAYEHGERSPTPTSQKADLLEQGTLDNLRISERVAGSHIENADTSEYLSMYHDPEGQEAQKLSNVEYNDSIWFPPPPEDEEDDAENGFFEYDDEDDDVGQSGMLFPSSSFGDDEFPIKEKAIDAQKVLLRASVNGHFRALVSQLLKGEGIPAGNDDGEEGWLEVVSSLAWQAANFVKPDTSREGSMDPGDYVKVKCILSGSPKDSTLVKGVVCTKNVKLKRMISQHRSPRLLLLGGALEFQKVSNKLASIETILQEEIDHLKMAVSKIESHKPNVLLVEKSVSLYAQEYLHAKEISLVLNVKRPLLERISRCTGAQIAPSIDGIASTRLGSCQVFRVQRITEECSSGNQSNKKSSRTLMFFDGCPRRLGCTVLLRGTCREELKKVKHVLQYASFAAYHLSLETSFLADSGAALPKLPQKCPVEISTKMTATDSMLMMSASTNSMQLVKRDEIQALDPSGVYCTHHFPCVDVSSPNYTALYNRNGQEERESSNDYYNSSPSSIMSPYSRKRGLGSAASAPDLTLTLDQNYGLPFEDMHGHMHFPTDICENVIGLWEKVPAKGGTKNRRQHEAGYEGRVTGMCFGSDAPASGDYISTSENQQSILVSLSSSCVLKGTICERSKLLRIKFYGSFDKPLGRYLRDDLFDQTSHCICCKEPPEGHVRCFTHQQGNLTISVKRLSSMKLPGEHDGRIWMWHRCLKCTHKDGVPPATCRVVMSDAAWGLSFGKFLELSFSNHATANRVASCGHSLQRDCLRFFGLGSIVAVFRYSPVDILSVRLPPPVLEFTCQSQEEWFRREAAEVSSKVELLYGEVLDVLRGIEKKITNSVNEPSKASLCNVLMELKDLLKNERYKYNGLLQPGSVNNFQTGQAAMDILELNYLRRCLLIDSYVWDRRIYLLDSKVKGSSSEIDAHLLEISTHNHLMQRSESLSENVRHDCSPEGVNEKTTTCSLNEPTGMELSAKPVECHVDAACAYSVSNGNCSDLHKGSGAAVEESSLESLPSPGSCLSDKIDLAWTGTGHSVQVPVPNVVGGIQDNLRYRKVITPVRVYSFDSALRVRDRIHRDVSLHLPSGRSFDAVEDHGILLRDPIPNFRRAYSQTSPRGIGNLKFLFGHMPLYVSSASGMVRDGARLLLPQTGSNNVVAVYDKEPTSIIAYVLSSKEHADFVSCSSDQKDDRVSYDQIKDGTGNLWGSNATASTLHPIEIDDIQSRYCGSDETPFSQGSVSLDVKQCHFKFTFDDELSIPAEKAKFSVACYFAKQFDALRRKCCPSEVDFICSLSRCRRWDAQGGKSNVYFAKSLDERFIIKQVTKTELDSFEEFAPRYFSYMMESINSGSPTCLAKILGIYQVTIKHLKGGREVRMDLMMMENLFYRRNISRVYDLKGSSRSRYNSDTTGRNKVMLDLNLLESLRTKPIFLGSKAKRILERAIWNDTSFLASVDVMDYSLLVGVDEERKELVLGIIDFLRQYTWDKHLETWVKASGILGGSTNASPTVISPKQYKKRFRKAMSTYFLTVPDQWSS